MPRFAQLKRVLFGRPRDIRDPQLFHHISLIAFLAWIGLGADGLSSSAYGPDEAFRALGAHTYLAVFLALATALTVCVIAFSYSRIIEHFPTGGGGYVVASKLLGPAAGLVSGSALLVDYVLTITVSVASGADQIFSLLPLAWHGWKLPAVALAIGLLVVMNIRGVKESVSILLPVFMLFIVTHAVALLGALAWHARELPAVAAQVAGGLRSGLSTLGLGGLLLLFVRAYSRGAGTYTGIEAVSNGLTIMREPRVATGKRTMAYLAVSLAVTAGGILLCYLLLDVRPAPGKTLNAVLLERLPLGRGFVVLALAAEAALLFVAAQTGFIDGPRVMANMALDSWLPRRFSSLSERLTMHYGIVLMGAAAVLTLWYTRGAMDRLVTMYSINVFVTFSLTQLGMCRFWLRGRRGDPSWRRALAVHAVGLLLCAGVLALVVIEKFTEGAGLTLLVTAGLVALCALIRRHYRNVARKLGRLSQMLSDLPAGPAAPAAPAALDPHRPTAVLLVGGYGGLGIHSLLAIFRQFPGFYQQAVFVSVAVVDSGAFKGAAELEHLRAETQQALDKYVTLARGFGLAAASRMAAGTDPLAEIEALCLQLGREYPRATFFAGKLIFRKDTWYQRLLHNETAAAIQRRLQWEGLPTVVLPVRVRE